MNSERTIAAVATPLGSAAVSMIRLSGPEALPIALVVLRRSSLRPRYATLAHAYDAEQRPLDELIATYFAAPASFTGEDVVEFCCHGGVLVTQRVLERLLACGAVPAEPGEFSRRAFENGRMDLTQAEAVMDIINAGSDLALRAAQNQLQGAIAQRVQALVDSMVDVAAHVEAYIDFPEEDIPEQTQEMLLARLEEVAAGLRSLLQTAEQGRILREGVRTVIIGAPNVGKSSLLNMLLGYERAIVSSTAGTTRDTIEETLSVGGLCLRLIDTAGLHESTDAVERSGMERSRQALRGAELVLEVADLSRPPQELDLEETGAKRLRLLNKCDLPADPAWEGVEGIRLSCRSGRGREELEKALLGLFLQDTGDLEHLSAINARHRYALQSALEALGRAKESLLAEAGSELVDVDLRECLEALGSVTGRVDTEDILTRVFSIFCLGK